MCNTVKNEQSMCAECGVCIQWHTDHVHCLESFIVMFPSSAHSWAFPGWLTCRLGYVSGGGCGSCRLRVVIACMEWFHALFKASAFGLVCTCRNLIYGSLLISAWSLCGGLCARAHPTIVRRNTKETCCWKKQNLNSFGTLVRLSRKQTTAAKIVSFFSKCAWWNYDHTSPKQTLLIKTTWSQPFCKQGITVVLEMDTHASFAFPICFTYVWNPFYLRGTYVRGKSKISFPKAWSEGFGRHKRNTNNT